MEKMNEGINFIQGLNKKLHHLKRFRIAATALHGMTKFHIAATALHKIIPQKENKKIMHFIFVFFKKTLLFACVYALNTNYP